MSVLRGVLLERCPSSEVLLYLRKLRILSRQIYFRTLRDEQILFSNAQRHKHSNCSIIPSKWPWNIHSTGISHTRRCALGRVSVQFSYAPLSMYFYPTFPHIFSKHFQLSICFCNFLITRLFRFLPSVPPLLRFFKHAFDATMVLWKHPNEHLTSNTASRNSSLLFLAASYELVNPFLYILHLQSVYQLL